MRAERAQALVEERAAARARERGAHPLRRVADLDVEAHERGAHGRGRRRGLRARAASHDARREAIHQRVLRRARPLRAGERLRDAAVDVVERGGDRERAREPLGGLLLVYAASARVRRREEQDEIRASDDVRETAREEGHARV